MSDIRHRVYLIAWAAWRQRYTILVPVLLMPVLGALVGMLAPRTYQTHTSMLIQETAKMNPFLEDLAVSSLLEERMGALKTLLHSRHILTAVATERGMIDDSTSDRARDAAIDTLSAALRVRLAGADLVRLELSGPSPDGLEETLESVSRHFVQYLLAPERSAIEGSATFLETQLAQRRADLERAETALAAFKDRNADALPELHAANVARLANLRQRLGERRAELAGAERSLGSLSQQLSEADPVVGRIEEQIIARRAELARLRVRYTERHSQVLATERQLKRLENERRRALAAPVTRTDPGKLLETLSSAELAAADGEERHPLLLSQLRSFLESRTRVESLAEETARLEAMIGDLEAQTEAYGRHERELLRLERDLAVKRRLYGELLERFEMARVTGALASFESPDRVKVIDEPFRPGAPTNPGLLIYVIAGAAGGLGLGGGIALLLELADGTVRTRRQLAVLANAPVLGRLPALTPRAPCT